MRIYRLMEEILNIKKDEKNEEIEENIIQEEIKQENKEKTEQEESEQQSREEGNQQKAEQEESKQQSGEEGNQQKTEQEESKQQSGEEGNRQKTEQEESEQQSGEEGNQQKTEQEESEQQSGEEGNQQKTEQEESEQQSREERNQQKTEQEESKQQSEQEINDAKKAFREMLKFKPEQEISRGNGIIEIENRKEVNNNEVPNSVINIIIEKFIKKRFIPNETDLNSRRDSMIPTQGDLKWNIPDLIKHRATKQYNQMLHDKYGYKSENGKEEKIPLAFYFDLSGSMEEYSRILSLMTLKLLKNDIKVLIGYNEKIEYQINSIPKKFEIEDMKSFFNKE